MKKPRILFMGTAPFALPALALLIEQTYPLVGVVTQPDRPRGRGLAVVPSPVKVFAMEHRLAVYQPERLQEEGFLAIFRELAPDMIVLAAYGQLLTREIIDRQLLGCLNIHPSLLPKYRGAAPINWAIINGEKETGVTIIKMAVELDAGDIVLQDRVPIGADELCDHLHDRLARRGAELLVQAIEMTVNGKARPFPQDGTAATYAPRLRKEDGLIRWERGAAEIVNLVRGLSPVPGAYTFLDGKMLKILAARRETGDTSGVPAGTIVREGPELRVAAAGDWVRLIDVQLENKKRMSLKDFLRGYQVRSGTVLGIRGRVTDGS